MDIHQFSEEQRRILGRQEAVERLARSTAHEINNVLQSLTVHLYFAKESAAAKNASIADLVEAEKSAVGLHGISNHLRQIGRPADVICVPLALDQWLPNVAANWRARQSAGVDVQVALAALPPASADTVALQGAIVALLDNAVQFAGSPSPQIGIGADVVVADGFVESGLSWIRGSSFVRVAVTNDGRAMTPEVRARACDPYFTTRESQRSAGQGLALAWRALRAMGGFVHIHETTVGARVSLFLPVADEAASMPWPGQQTLADVLACEG